MTALGIAIALAGATVATVATRRLEHAGRVGLIPLALVPAGAVIGVGAAVAQDASLLQGTLAGAVWLPLLGVGWLLLAGRRAGRSHRGPGGDRPDA